MKKTTATATVVIMVVVIGIVGCYAYLSGKAKDAAASAKMTNTQLVLSRDLEKDYPPTVKEVITYFTEIQKCFYNEDCTDEEIVALGMQARGLYDADLLENNETASYLVNLESEIKDFKSKNYRISKVSVGASTSVEYFSEDGFDFARISCGYTVPDSEGTVFATQAVQTVYLLRRDENRRWKIYGWEQSTGSLYQ